MPWIIGLPWEKSGAALLRLQEFGGEKNIPQKQKQDVFSHKHWVDDNGLPVCLRINKPTVCYLLIRNGFGRKIRKPIFILNKFSFTIIEFLQFPAKAALSSYETQTIYQTVTATTKNGKPDTYVITGDIGDVVAGFIRTGMALPAAAEGRQKITTDDRRCGEPPCVLCID